jgi:hypothetical protein
MRIIKAAQVGELLQAIYDTETHLRIYWMWDGGFNFEYGCMDDFDEHPQKVRELYRKIDAKKIEQVASLILMEYEINHSIVDSYDVLNSMGEFIKKLSEDTSR